jgi:hypothetical protein
VWRIAMFRVLEMMCMTYFYVFIGRASPVDPLWTVVDIGIGSSYDGGVVGGFCAWRRLWLA